MSEDPPEPELITLDITVSPFYHSAVNEVTKPSSLVFVSHYFADRWMRELGPLGSALVICLRSKCYHDRSKGELRDRVKIAVPDVAAEIGVSPKTVRRELEAITKAGTPLARFLRVHISYAPGRTPESVRRDANTYQVAMDDPVHPLDEPDLLAAVRAKEIRAEKGGAAESEQEAKESARRQGREGRQSQKPPGHSDQAAVNPLVILAPPLDNLASGTPVLTRPSGQNDQALKDSFLILKNPLNSSSEFSLSLFSGQDVLAKPRPLETVRRWDDLTEAEQQQYFEQAGHELVALHVGSGITPKPKLIQVRARNLYNIAQKKNNG